MNIVVLTTETPHHTYFVRELSRVHKINCVIIEEPPLPPFDTHHPFEDERDRYENQVFFKGKVTNLKDVIQDIIIVKNINDNVTLKYLQEKTPNVVITFGTRIIKKEVIATCPTGFLNLHGGDPEEYRGLDTHLWAICHGDFSGLVVTLHMLTEELDGGAILLKKEIPIKKGMKIHELRRFNVETCLELTRRTLDTLKRNGHFTSTPQQKIGRTYSYMPASLKEICKGRFERYSAGLDF